MSASAGWGYFFVTDTLQIWHAMVLLVLHGCAGVLWITSSQMLLYDIVGPAALAERGAPERDRALSRRARRPRRRQLDHADARARRAASSSTRSSTCRSSSGSSRAPYGRHFRGERPAPRRAVRGLADIVQTVRDVRGDPGARGDGRCSPAARRSSSATATRRRCRASRTDLGHGDPGVAYTHAARRGRRRRARRGLLAREPRRVCSAPARRRR